MDEFTTHKGVQLTSSVRNAVWIDLSNNHTSTREFLEEQIKEACVNKNDTSPVMVKGAFGIGKTATLHYLFHYAWTKLKVPAFYVNLEQIIEELKIYVKDQGLTKLPNTLVSKFIGDLLDTQVGLLKTCDFNEIDSNKIFFPSFSKGNLQEYITGFKPAILHTTNNGGFINKSLPLFDIKTIKEFNPENRYLLLVDEFESKYHELKKLIQSSEGGLLRHFFDDISSISSTNYYCIIGNGPASGYELNVDLVDNLPESNAAQQRRLTVKQIFIPTVDSLSKSFLKDYPIGHVNFFWWLSRSRPGQIKKLKESIQPYDDLMSGNYASFIRDNKVLEDPIDDIGEANVTFLKTEVFQNLNPSLKDIVKDLLVKLQMHKRDNNTDESKNLLLEGKDILFASNKPIDYNKIIGGLQKIILKRIETNEKYQIINFDLLHVYLDLILRSITDENKRIAFGCLDKTNVEKALHKGFLVPLFGLLYDFISIYEDETEEKTKRILDLVLELIAIAEDADNIEKNFREIYDLFDINQQREPQIFIQLNLFALRESIEQPIGSPILSYKNNLLEDKIKEIESFNRVIIYKKGNEKKELIFIPNYNDNKLLETYIENLKDYFTKNWKEEKNYFEDGELITNIIYFEENDLIDEFKSWLIYATDDNSLEELPYFLKKLDIVNFTSYQLHNSQRIADYLDSLCKILTIALKTKDLTGANYDKELIEIDKLIVDIKSASWTESKQSRRTIEHYADILLSGDNCAFNQIFKIAESQYRGKLSEYIENIQGLKDYSYNIKVNDLDHFGTVNSIPSRNYISYFFAENKQLPTELRDILSSTHKLNLYPENDEEELSMVSFDVFIFRFKNDLKRILEDFEANDKTFNGLLNFINLLVKYDNTTTIEEFIDLLHCKNHLVDKYFEYLGFSSVKKFYLKGIYLTRIAQKLNINEGETTLIKNLNERNDTLRSYSTSLLEYQAKIRLLVGLEDDFIQIKEIDDYYTNIVIPYLAYFEKHDSASIMIMGKYFNDTLTRKIKTIENFNAQILLIQRTLEAYKKKIDITQNKINELYEKGGLTERLFKDKYGKQAKNGEYIYNRIFMPSFKQLNAGEPYREVFDETYKPSNNFYLKKDTVEKFIKTLDVSFQNKIPEINELLNEMTELDNSVKVAEEIEYKLSELIKIDINE